jgi:hypothetical protein
MQNRASYDLKNNEVHDIQGDRQNVLYRRRLSGVKMKDGP